MHSDTRLRKRLIVISSNPHVTKNPDKEVPLQQTASVTAVGRPRSLSPAALERVLTLHANGLGYRAIAEELGRVGIDVNWSTVRRAVKGWPPYDLIRVSTRTPDQEPDGATGE